VTTAARAFGGSRRAPCRPRSSVPIFAACSTRRIRTDRLCRPLHPTRAAKAPSGPGWVHEIKHDGYRLIVRRDGEAMRLFTRRRHDWTDRYPAIAAAAAKPRANSVTLDGEAVVVGHEVLPCSTPCIAAATRPTEGPKTIWRAQGLPGRKRNGEARRRAAAIETGRGRPPDIAYRRPVYGLGLRPVPSQQGAR
jgi:hypothetical protein